MGEKIRKVARVLPHFRNCAGHFFNKYSYPLIKSVNVDILQEACMYVCMLCMKVLCMFETVCVVNEVSSTRGRACPLRKEAVV